MQKAKLHLEEARREPQRATADTGGHRIRAIELVEVNAGIEFDDNH